MMLTKTRAAILAVIVGGILTLSDPLIVAYAGTQAALWLLLGACLVLLVLLSTLALIKFGYLDRRIHYQ